MQRMRDYESKISDGMRKASLGESPSNTKPVQQVRTLPRDGAASNAKASSQEEQSESSMPDVPVSTETSNAYSF